MPPRIDDLDWSRDIPPKIARRGLTTGDAEDILATRRTIAEPDDPRDCTMTDHDDCICPNDGNDHLPQCAFADEDQWEEGEIVEGKPVRMRVGVVFESDEYRTFSAMMRARGEWHPNRYLKSLALDAIEEWQATPPNSAIAEID